eukprot:gene2133-6020_t
MHGGGTPLTAAPADADVAIEAEDGGDGPPPASPGAGGRGGDGDGGGGGGSSHPALGLWRGYSSALDSHPLYTKAITAAVLGALGDLLAQRSSGAAFDPQRLLAVTLDGLLVSGPMLHLGYTWLESAIPCAGRGSKRNTLLQVLVDELVFDPLFIGAFFFTTGAVERQHPWRETLPNLRRSYWPTLRSGLITSTLLMPVQFFSFRHLPVKLRVLVCSLGDVAWDAAVSHGRHSEREKLRATAEADAEGEAGRRGESEMRLK